MILKGNPASRGIVIGEVLCYQSQVIKPEQGTIIEEDILKCLEKYEAIKHNTDKELEILIERLQQDDSDKAEIFMAHREILNDEVINKEIKGKISEELFKPDWAIYSSYKKYTDLLGKVKGELIKERVQDIQDVCKRLLFSWNGVKTSGLDSLKNPVVIACHDLLPSDTATLDRSNVLAILTEIGGETSHSAIIARSYGIPAILGISDLMKNISQGEMVIVDALEGKLITEPAQQEIDDYEERRRAFQINIKENSEYLSKYPYTKEGVRIDIGINIGSAEESSTEYRRYSDFVGLFRTEFIYMTANKLPTEDEQYEIYKKVISENNYRPVIVRTLDIGGDKTLPCLKMSEEDNPFLGKRALRLCFDNKDIFNTQLRAILRASVHGNPWIMLPMVSSIDDIHRAKNIINRTRLELRSNGINFNEDVKIGIMVEVPSIALIADKVAIEVDFISIGTNDLCQYLMAADRMNPELSSYYQSFHPSMFRIMGTVIEQFNKVGKPVSICGELGGNPLAVPVLLGLGIRKLSMSGSSMAEIKKIISKITIKFAEKIAQKVQSLSTENQVIQYLENEIGNYL